MVGDIKKELGLKVQDKKLVNNFFSSFQKISEKYIAQNPVDLLQNTGLFVESALRIAENFVLGAHTPLSSKFNVDICIRKLEKASGFEGLRIHVARLSRAIYDFRSRKKSVHLKLVDPQLVDANLIFTIATWIVIEILKESGTPNAEGTIQMLHTRKVPLVQSVGGILRTTNPKLMGTQRILLLLYSTPEGLSEDKLLEGTKTKIKNKNHLLQNLKNLESRDLVHQLPNNKWTLFGNAYREAEKIIKDFTR